MNTTLLNTLTEKAKGIVSVVLLALVTMVALADQAHAADSEFDYSSQTLRVGVWIENLDEGDVLDRGEEIAVGFQTNEDAYAVVYRIDTEGLVTVLWPRSRMDDGFVFGGHEYLMPVTGSPRLVAGSRTGEGFVEAVISRYPFDLRELALDFHHEYDTDKYDFIVAGDPFLAMNEVNFAVTGMEDSADFVVTNYLSYYVHEEVDHPRYLCNQCHLDDDLANNPYDDQCTIDITFNHDWANDWYDNEGYYPVYYNPVYVYYDPWTWRPWVNFWYEPFYTCPSRPGYHYNYTSYVWCDSPYYHYDGTRVKTGRGLYQRPDQAHNGRHKTADYTRVSPNIAQRGPTDGERDAMRQKRRVPTIASGVGYGGITRNPSTSPEIARGQRPMSRTRPVIETPVRGSSRGGLQIRPGGSRTTTKPGNRDRTVNVSPVRTNPGGRNNSVRPGGIFPVRGSGTGGSNSSTTVRGTSRSIPQRSETARPSRGASGDGKIKPVEPRKKGTRIWNSRSGSQSGDRKVRTPARNNSGRKGSSDSSVRPRSGNSNSGSSSRSSSSTVKPKSSNRSSSGSSGSRSGSGSSRSGGSSKSSSGKSSSKSSSSKSGRDGGSSRSRR